MEGVNIKRNIKPFDGEKYSVWKFRIRALLTELNVISVIDDEVPDMLTDKWTKADRTAKNTIIEYLSDSFLNFAESNNSARQVFENLDSIYERKSLATQLALRKKLLTLKLQRDTPLLKHFKVFDEIITELAAAGAKLEETDKVSHLLLTLPTSYDGVITAIETLSEDNLTLAFVKTRLLDHEIKLNDESRDTSLKVLQANKIPKRMNFESANMYKKNQGQLRKGQFKSNKLGAIKCHHCGRKGHMKKDCFYYKRSIQHQAGKDKTAQVVQVANTPSTSNQNTSSFAFMAGDFDQEGDGERIVFPLDSGASDHLINREDLATNFEDLQMPIRISVAKSGTFIAATKRGSLNIGTTMGIPGTIEEVYYCPDVPYNLLSVRRIQQAGMTVIFDEEGVKICKSGSQLADAMTKPLPEVKFLEFRTGMGLE